MSPVSPFQDSPPQPSAAKTPPECGSPTPQLSSREAMRVARQIAADASAGRSSYTMGMLVVMTMACAAILGVCGTTLQDLMTSQETRKGLIESIIAGGAAGLVLGAIVAVFVRVSIQTIFLGAMTGGLLGAIATPSALFAENSPTAALVAAALAGPFLILVVSYAFSKLSRRPSQQGQAPEPTSPWEPLPKTIVTTAETPVEPIEEEMDEPTHVA